MVDRTRTREVHHVGVTQGKKNALEELAALRRGDVVGNRTQQLKVIRTYYIHCSYNPI